MSNRTTQRALFALFMIFPLGACESKPAVAPAAEPAAAPGAEVAAQPKRAKPEPAWVSERVAAAEARLKAAGKAGELIARALEAHGGLARWYNAGPVEFRFRYEPVDKQKVRDSVQVVDTWSSRAVHHLPGDESKRFGWDGTRAWRTYEDETIEPRFWAMTPFYFMAMPFVLADEGVNLTLDGESNFEEETYELVRATFDPGTGDAPDDFYVVYLDRDDGRVAGVRYVVSYPGFFPDGGHTPEKFMKYDGSQTVGGLTFPDAFRTFAWDAGKQEPGELVTNSTLSELAFRPEIEDAFFAIPEGEGVEIVEGM